MAKKKQAKPVQQPPSDDEEVEISEEEDERVKASSGKKLKPPSCAATISTKQASTVVAVVAAKKKKKKARGSGEAQTSTALASPTMKNKRPSEETYSAGKEEEEKPKFRRLFSEQDEIFVLQGIIDFKTETEKTPVQDKNGIYEFVKGSISFEVSIDQFMEKIKTLKRKFLGKIEKKGKGKAFANAHDEKIFELSKIIWGCEVESVAASVKSRKSERSTKRKLEEVEEKDVSSILGEDWFNKSYLVGLIASFGMEEDYVKQRWTLSPMEEKKKIEEQWKYLYLQEMRFVLSKLEFEYELASCQS